MNFINNFKCLITETKMSDKLKIFQSVLDYFNVSVSDLKGMSVRDINTKLTLDKYYMLTMDPIGSSLDGKFNVYVSKIPKNLILDKDVLKKQYTNNPNLFKLYYFGVDDCKKFYDEMSYQTYIKNIKNIPASEEYLGELLYFLNEEIFYDIEKSLNYLNFVKDSLQEILIFINKSDSVVDSLGCYYKDGLQFISCLSKTIIVELKNNGSEIKYSDTQIYEVIKNYLANRVKYSHIVHQILDPDKISKYKEFQDFDLNIFKQNYRDNYQYSDTKYHYLLSYLSGKINSELYGYLSRLNTLPSKNKPILKRLFVKEVEYEILNSKKIWK